MAAQALAVGALKIRANMVESLTLLFAPTPFGALKAYSNTAALNHSLTMQSTSLVGIGGRLITLPAVLLTLFTPLKECTAGGYVEFSGSFWNW